MKVKKTLLIGVVICLFVLAVLGTFSFSSDSKDKLDSKALHKDTALQPQIGNKKSDVKLVLFGDYKCPYCGDFESQILPKIQKDYIETNKVELRYVNVLIHGEESKLSTRASLAVNKFAPEAYWSFHEALYRAQPKSKEAVSDDKWLTEQLVEKEINKLKIKPEQKKQILNAYNDKVFHQQAKHDDQLAKQYKVSKVPSLYVNGERVKDVTDYEAVKGAIDQALDEQKNK
ncbi:MULTISPECIES: DsbA family protein [unclassified Staphylococcus]|uniref:DsbA family protein n=1 Tax=unclassified Staphylococcus TaxID=91994 RepID=UPI0021D3ADCB|nr:MULTISPECIES: DsbA family protein [unclassified Staphylococcus]UXR78345.1 DsbA family protein [Staphylococcus sp. IVB6227]UXR82510.1 DsbA family protein [Staphylococcus sp. IVB6214]